MSFAWLCFAAMFAATVLAVTPDDLAAIHDAYVHCPVPFNNTLLDSFACECVNPATGETQPCRGGLDIPDGFVWPAPLFLCGRPGTGLEGSVVSFTTPYFSNVACTDLPPLTGSSVTSVSISSTTTVAGGTLPTQWGQLSLSAITVLGQPQTPLAPASLALSGTIPTEWSSLKLTDLNLQAIPLVSGTIPESLIWPASGSKRHVLLSALPKVSGTIPEVPKDAPAKLLALEIVATAISGTLPRGYGDVSSLVVDYNTLLSGTVPQSLNANKWNFRPLQLMGNNFTCPVRNKDGGPAPAIGACLECSIWNNDDCSGKPFFSGPINQGACFTTPSGNVFGLECQENKKFSVLLSYNTTPPFCGYSHLLGAIAPDTRFALLDQGHKCKRPSANIGEPLSAQCRCPGRVFGYAWSSPISTVVPLFVFLIWCPLSVIVAAVILFHVRQKADSLAAAVRSVWPLVIYQFAWVGIIILFPSYVAYFHSALDYSSGAEALFHMWLWGNVVALMASSFVVAWMMGRPGLSRVTYWVAVAFFGVALFLFIVVAPSVVSAHVHRERAIQIRNTCDSRLKWSVGAVTSELCSDHFQGLAGMKAGWVMSWLLLGALFVGALVVGLVSAVASRSSPAGTTYEEISSG